MHRGLVFVLFALVACVAARKVCVTIYRDTSCTSKLTGGCVTSGSCTSDEGVYSMASCNSTAANVKIYESAGCTGDVQTDSSFPLGKCVDLGGAGQVFTCSATGLAIPSVLLALAVFLNLFL
eukprot:m.264240 g.264240  ORF g.264240 m.264240 type:complete len:122 (+) comp27611_c0_seq1:92-457(+)